MLKSVIRSSNIPVPQRQFPHAQNHKRKYVYKFGHISCAAFGQATLTIPGTNISIPLANTLNQQNQQVTTQPQAQQATTQQANQQTASQPHNQQTNAQQTNQQTATQQQNQQANAAQQQKPQTSTITIPGTNIQIPTSVAAANGILNTTNLQNIKVEGTGKDIKIQSLIECQTAHTHTLTHTLTKAHRRP